MPKKLYDVLALVDIYPGNQIQLAQVVTEIAREPKIGGPLRRSQVRRHRRGRQRYPRVPWVGLPIGDQ